MTASEFNLQRIVSSVIGNDDVIKAIKHLNSEQQLAAAAIVLGVELKIEDLPVIPDNDYARNIRVTSINPLFDCIIVEYTSLARRRWVNQEYVWEARREPIECKESMSLSTYYCNVKEWSCG